MAEEVTMNESTENNTKPNDSVIENNSNEETEAQTDSGVENNSSQNDGMGKISIVNIISLQNDSVTKDVTQSENKSSQNDTAIEEVPASESQLKNEKTVTNKSVSEDKAIIEKNKPPDIEDAKKAIVLYKLNKGMKVEVIRKLVKKHTNDEIVNNIDNMYMKVDHNGTSCIVKFKSAIIAAEARFRLEFNTNKQPFYLVKMYQHSEYGNKRSATDNVSPVPEKLQKIDNKAEVGWKGFINTKSTRTLFFDNVPSSWTKIDIMQFIKKQTVQVPQVLIGVLYIYTENIKPSLNITGKCHVLFENEDLCKLACKYLRKAERRFDGLLMTIEYEFPDSEYAIVWLPNNRPDVKAIKQIREDKQTHQKNIPIPVHQNQSNFPMNQKWPQKQEHNNQNQNWNQESGNVPSNPLFVNQNVNLNDTYGLSLQYLESIGIKPPLTAKICVDNLTPQYEDENMIRKLFGHAGTVKDVAYIYRSSDKMLIKVDFDHPVEAIQAISMFNNQEVYGKTLIVTMDQSHNAYKTFFPPGLKCFGPGLCPDGTIMKNVRNSLELQRAVNMLLQQMDGLKQSIDNLQKSLQQTAEELKNSVNQAKQVEANAAQNQLSSMANTLTNAPNNSLLALSALLNPQAAQIVNLLKQQTAGNILSPALTQMAVNQPVNQQPQDVIWNANVLNNQPGITNIQGAPNVQLGQNVPPFGQSGQQIQAATNVQGSFAQGGGAGTFTQAGINTATGQFSQTGQYAQGGSNPPSSPFTQCDPNAAIGQNVPGGPYGQGGPNMATGQYAQSGQNMATVQFAQSGQNLPTTQFGQSGHNVPNEQFSQGPNTASGPYGQHVSTGQLSQVGQNVPVGQFAHGGPNMSTGPFNQGGQNVPAGQYGQAGPNAPFNQVPVPSQGSQNAGAPRRHDTCTVQFSYLPPSVTLASLNSKMREVGEVRSAEMTGPGRALVTFYTPRDAATCIKLLDHTKVDGQTIEVKYY